MNHSIDNDTFLKVILEIKDDVSCTKESVGRTEEQMRHMINAKYEDRLKSLEGSRNQVYGMITIVTIAWGLLIGWIAGLGEVVHNVITHLLAVKQ